MGKQLRRFGTVDQRKAGYRARYTHPDTGRAVTQTFTTRRLAERWLRDEQSALERGDRGAARLSKRTLGEYGDEWLRVNAHRWKPSTARHYATGWNVHINPHLGQLPVARLTRELVRAWHADRLADTGQAAVASAYRTLHAIMAQAVADDYVSSNPCTIRGAGQTRKRDNPALTPGQVQAVMDAVAPRYRALVAVLAYTGMRPGEAVALRRGDVHDDGHSIVLDVSKAIYEGDENTPKTAAGVRAVAVPASLHELLRGHLSAYAQPDDDGLLFVTREGTTAHDAARRAMRRAMDACGLPDYDPYELRHYYGTMATALGAPLADVGRAMGHGSTASTLRYLQPTTAGSARIAAQLDEQITAGGNVVPLHRNTPPRRRRTVVAGG